MPTLNPVTLTRARQDSLRRLPRDGSQPRQPRRSPPQLPPVRTRPPLWPRRHPHNLPTRRLTNKAVITRPARLTHNRERSPANLARPQPRQLTRAISLRRHALILPFVAWVNPSLGERFYVTGQSRVCASPRNGGFSSRLLLCSQAAFCLRV